MGAHCKVYTYFTLGPHHLLTAPTYILYLGPPPILMQRVGALGTGWGSKVKWGPKVKDSRNYKQLTIEQEVESFVLCPRVLSLIH